MKQLFLSKYYLCCKWVDCAEESGLANGREKPDGEGEAEKGLGIVDPLQEAEQHAGRSCQERAVDEETPRSDGVDVFTEEWRKQDRCYEN